MNTYRADLHMHTILSPCGDLQMSPQNIITEAAKKGMDIIGITDHNSTRQAKLVRELGIKQGIFVLCGAEITTKEEAHVLAFMPDDEKLAILQSFLDENLPDIPNDENQFGYQVCVDEREDIVFQEDRLLISGIQQSVDVIEKFVHHFGGIFIPAHINRPRYSIISQLGFVSSDLDIDALELSRHITKDDFLQQNHALKDYAFIRSSDAHFVADVGTIYTKFVLEKRSFDEIKLALHSKKGRHIINK